MLIALGATAASSRVTGYGVLIGAIGVGTLIGAILAARVGMTSMPELVAILHSFVGAAAVLVGIGSHLAPAEHATHVEHLIHEVEVFVGVFIGAITFTGSVVAFWRAVAWSRC
jgi:NAD(P) transhydrogenase subunit beta